MIWLCSEHEIEFGLEFGIATGKKEAECRFRFLVYRLCFP